MPAAAAGGHAVVLGGGDATTRVAVYDPATDRWAARPDSRVPRFFGQAVSVGETVFALGGVASGSGSRTQVECFDPPRGRWRE